VINPESLFDFKEIEHYYIFLKDLLNPAFHLVATANEPKD